MQDSIKWFALYNDGETLFQEDAEGNKHAYSDIDRSRLTHFLLYASDKERPIFCAEFDGDGKDLIWRRRVQNINGESTVFHIVSKQDKYVAIVTEGNVQIYDRFDEGFAPLLPPIATEEEKNVQ